MPPNEFDYALLYGQGERPAVTTSTTATVSSLGVDTLEIIAKELMPGELPLSPYVIWSEYVIRVEKEPRTWKERLFSWPWRPWQKHRIVEYPSICLLTINGCRQIVAHPSFQGKLLGGRDERYRG